MVVNQCPNPYVNTIYTITLWWFGPIFSHTVGNGMSSSQLTNSIIFQRGRYTTNQIVIPNIIESPHFINQGFWRLLHSDDPSQQSSLALLARRRCSDKCPQWDSSPRCAELPFGSPVRRLDVVWFDVDVDFSLGMLRYLRYITVIGYL